MELVTKTFDEITQIQATAMQASITSSINKIINFTTGSVWLAATEANSGVALWLQAEIVKLLSVTRLATSEGDDVYSFVEDFGMTIPPATKSSGEALFSRYSNTNEAIIKIGQQVETATDHIKFNVVDDTTNPYYDSVNEWYLIPAGVSSSNIKVEAVEAGANGNILQHTLTIITTPIPYIDKVDNSLPFTNGADQASPDEVKALFPIYINSLSKATETALISAILSVQDGIEYSLVENKSFDTGEERLGMFYAIIDDGSGNPPQELLDSVYNVLYDTRGFSIMPAVYAPEQLLLDVEIDILVDTGKYDETEVENAVIEGISSYIEGIGVGNILYYNQVIRIAIDSFDGITDAENLTLNGGIANITPTPKQAIVLNSITVNIVDISI